MNFYYCFTLPFLLHPSTCLRHILRFSSHNRSTGLIPTFFRLFISSPVNVRVLPPILSFRLLTLQSSDPTPSVKAPIMSNDDDTKPEPGPSSQVLEDVAARSASTKKRKCIEEPQSQANPPRKRQRVRKPKPKWDPNAPPQATTSPPPPTTYAFVHELPQNWQAWGDSTGDTPGPSQMYSSQVREYDANASSSISIAPTTSVLDAQGMGRGRKHEAYQSKPDLKRKRKVEDVDLSIADTPQPMAGVPTGLWPLPLVRN